jgi:hypothetical protein
VQSEVGAVKPGPASVGRSRVACFGWEGAGDVVTVFQISQSKELVVEGKATIRKRVADIDEQYRVEFPISQA